MEGFIEVTYTVLCSGDIYEELEFKELLNNEKIARIIKTEYAKGQKGIEIAPKEDAKIIIKSQKELFTFTVNKDDFADIVVLAEEDAKGNKRLKKECDIIEIINIKTIERENNS
jgi:hypothetical protein